MIVFFLLDMISGGSASAAQSTDTHDPIWRDYSSIPRRKPKARRDTPEWWREIDAERADLRADLERASSGLARAVAAEEQAESESEGTAVEPPAMPLELLADARQALRRLDRAIRDQAAKRADKAAQEAAAQVAEIQRLALAAEAEEDDEIAVLMMVL